MRIGIFTECYHPTHNGVVISIDTFKKALEARGHDVYVIAPYNRHNPEKTEAKVIRLFSWGFHKDYPMAATSLLASKKYQIVNLKFDIFHFQHPFTTSNWGLKIAKKYKIPTVYTYHTLISEYTHYFPGPKIWKEKIAVNLSRSFCNKVDQVVTPSGPMKKLLLFYGVTQPIEVIPTGIDVLEFTHPFSHKELFSAWHIPENRHLLLYLARIAKEKNIDFLLSAVKLLLEKRNNFHLLLVGGGPQLEFYKSKAQKMGLRNYTTFTGMQKKPGVNRFFGAADIFVFPSITETQGIVITESMAAGVAPIAINKMGPSEIITNNVDGYLTDLNLTDFTDKINYLLDNPNLRKKMGAKAKINANKFSVANCTDNLEKLYENTINRNRS